MAKAAPQRPNSLVGLSSLQKIESFDSPQPPPSTPTRAKHLLSPPAVVTPRAVRTSLAKSPETPKKLAAGSSEKVKSPKSPKELRLPKLASSSSIHADAAGLQETQKSRITLPKL